MQFHSELPLLASVEIPDPVAAARALAHLPFPFLLHSSLADGQARWSFFGADPFAVFREDNYEDARRMARKISAQVVASDPPPTAVPFTGGIVGYWTYDFGRALASQPRVERPGLELPRVQLGFYDVVGAYDHQSRQAWLYSSGLPLDGGLRVTRAEQRLDHFLRLLGPGQRAGPRLPTPREEPWRPTSTFGADDYRASVARVQDHIRAGDIFQANLSQRWTIPFANPQPGSLALALHDALAMFSPAPYAAFLGAPDHAIASASPERFLELRGRRVETRPIKGTRPRSSDPAEDRRLRDELENSTKDRAENVMIVDVLRNDLGRVCDNGSVEVAGLCQLETFSQVHHLTSTVIGALRQGLDGFDLLHACLPGGSITGAPKIRAMEILDDLEPVRRHLYTGSIGYLDWRGDADWNIAIRTAIVTGTAIHFAAGGGITAESDPGEEYLETLHKAEGLRRSLEHVIGPTVLDPAFAIPIAPAG